MLHCRGYAKASSPAIGPVLTGARVPCLFTMHEYSSRPERRRP